MTLKEYAKYFSTTLADAEVVCISTDSRANKRLITMQLNRLITTSLLFCLVAVPANASIIQISHDSGTFELNANPMNILNSASPYFSSTDLATAHEILSNWGISTDGKITILPINTFAGLSFLTLIDKELGAGDTGSNASLGITSTASSSLGMYINDYSQDVWQLITPPFGSQTLGATFVWGSVGSGDGFAWTGLTLGDTFAYSFNDLDGEASTFDDEAFQFASWNDGGWEIVATSTFDANHAWEFTGMTIPGPPAALLIAAITLSCRRRRQ